MRRAHPASLVGAGKARRQAVLLFIGCMLLAAYAGAGGNQKLADIHATLKAKYETLQHVNASELETLPAAGLILLDVRQQGEFDVSHLAGAVRVAPDISTEDFMAIYRNLVNGKSLVFYCSVGQRSSALADRVNSGLISAGGTGVYNLEGGIFKWHNDGRALVSGGQATDFIHPYNGYWGRLIDRPELIRYQVQDQQSE